MTETVTAHSPSRRRTSARNFDLGSNINIDIPEYNSLYDKNLTNYFQSKVVRKHLRESFMVAGDGRILDPVSKRHELILIEKDFDSLKKQKEVAEKDVEYTELKKEADVKKVETFEATKRKTMAARSSKHNTMQQLSPSPKKTFSPSNSSSSPSNKKQFS